MISEHVLEVRAPPTAVFEFLSAPDNLVRAVPGATGVGGDDDHQAFVVRASAGDVSLAFRGGVEVTRRDRDGLVVGLAGRAREVSGKGKATADITARLVLEPHGGTRVELIIEIAMVGRVARHGGPVVERAAARIVGDLASRMRTELAESPSGVFGLMSRLIGRTPR